MREVPAEEAERVLGKAPTQAPDEEDSLELPPAKISEKSMPPAKGKLLKELEAIEAKEGVLTMEGILQRAVERARRERPQ